MDTLHLKRHSRRDDTRDGGKQTVFKFENRI